MNETAGNRRPLRLRQVEAFHGLARSLARLGIRPNTVSIASVVFAAVGGAALAASRLVSAELAAVCLLFAVLMISLRATCNLIDGLIAVEGGWKTKSGEVFNDFPDRLADACLFVAAGYGTIESTWGVPLGWLATCGALMTAYTRHLGGTVGARQYFTGPMAKPTRMAVLSVACLAATVERFLAGSSWSLVVGLAVIAAGTAVTTARRVRQIVIELES